MHSVSRPGSMVLFHRCIAHAGNLFGDGAFVPSASQDAPNARSGALSVECVTHMQRVGSVRVFDAFICWPREFDRVRPSQRYITAESTLSTRYIGTDQGAGRARRTYVTADPLPIRSPRVIHWGLVGLKLGRGSRFVKRQRYRGICWCETR